MLNTLLHRLLLFLYFALPVAALIWALIARRTGRRQALNSFLVTALAGLLLAIGLGVTYAYAAGGRVVPSQVGLAAYFAMGLLLILKCFDWLLTSVVARLFGVRRPSARGFAASERAPEPPDISTALIQSNDESGPQTDAAEAPLPVRARTFAFRFIAMQTVRIVILFGVGLPYVMACVMTYRPKVSPIQDPMSQLGFPFERVEFAAADGTKLAGWWIPASARSTPASRAQHERRSTDARLDTDRPWASQTVIVCHGLAADKSNQLLIAREYPSAGYNVLIFDFRAHGESGGQLTTFGDFERRDVLGAVKYLQAERPEQSQRILGVGASMGAAALIAAATDASPEGQAIEAIAVYGTYDDLGKLSYSIADLYFAPPMDWLLTRLAVPMAAAQTGADIKQFAPVQLVSKLWPRPILIIHGIDDEIISFEHGRDLFNAATLPKSKLWLQRMSHNAIIVDESASKAVLQFFKTAENVPVI